MVAIKVQNNGCNPNYIPTVAIQTTSQWLQYKLKSDGRKKRKIVYKFFIPSKLSHKHIDIRVPKFRDTR